MHNAHPVARYGCKDNRYTIRDHHGDRQSALARHCSVGDRHFTWPLRDIEHVRAMHLFHPYRLCRQVCFCQKPGAVCWRGFDSARVHCKITFGSCRQQRADRAAKRR